MKKILLIGIAGALGAIARTLLGQVIPDTGGFPVATLTVNVIGTFLLCFIVAGTFRRFNANSPTYDAVTTGFLGAFTTFSALSMETMTLVENGQLTLAASYIVLSIIGGLAVGALGFHLGGKRVRA